MENGCRRSCAHHCPARLGWYGAATGPCKEASTPLPFVASRGTERRRSHGKLPPTRAAPAGSTRALSCSEEAIPNRPELTPTPLRQEKPAESRGQIVGDSYGVGAVLIAGRGRGKHRTSGASS